MPNEGDARTSLLRRVSGSAWLTIAILAASGLLVIWWLVDGKPVATVTAGHQGVGDVSTDEAPGPSPELRTDPHSLAAGVPTPDAVVADPQCRMVVGQRTASDTALVYLPLGEGAWFAVVNSFGVVFDGTLPFVPERPVVGKRPDGTILAGFGLEGEVQVVHDGSVIYEFDDVWSFDIADDGSSFFVVEPLAGDASRLVIHNLELREQHHFDLGTTARPDHGLEFDLSYSIDFAEVIVQPSHREGGTSRFYPVVGGDPREVSTERRDAVPTTAGIRPSDTSLFASSVASYHAHLMGPTLRGEFAYRWRVFKIEREFLAGAERPVESWARDVRFMFLTMHLSSDGAWLVLSDVFTGVVVLDATDGETVFAYPRERDWRLEMWRYGLPFVNPEERFWGRFVGDRLYVSRWLEDKPDEGRHVEVYELNRFAQDARRVREFKVEQGADESEQAFAIRTTLDPDAASSCTDHAFLDRRLEIRERRLTYRAGPGV